MPDQIQFAEFANLLLTWVGFGTLVGLAAKTIMPGPDPGGTVATLLMGIVGTLIGCAVLKFIYPQQMFEPISGKGFLFGTFGALILLTFYKILGGHWFIEGDRMTSRLARRRKRRRYVIED